MKKILLSLGLVVFMILGWAMNGAAQEAKPAAAPEAKPVTSAEDIKNLLGMSVYLQGGYTFNFTSPDSGINEQRIFDQKADSFLLDLARVQFAKDAAMGGIGYKLKISAGETAKYIHSAGLGNTNDAFDLTEAYIDYLAPVGSGLMLRLGKFVTFHGAEVIEAKDNFNYSRSFLFNFAIPFTHTGGMAGYKFSELLTANLFLVNGWDLSADNNKALTYGAGFVFTPFEPVSLTFNFIYGPEQANNTANNRFLFDWVGSYKVTKNLTLMANFDYGHEDKALGNGNDAEWVGVAAYAKFDFNDFFSTAIRGEYFNDKNGARTGIAQELAEVTLTAEFKVAKAIVVRPEYRHDWSTQNGFDSRNRGFDAKSQDTLALGVMVTW